ncbi:DPP IV N-terminal domain-containing protein, partial [bacterium]|nr:DPP IV N-terminal domain-containing protein [bacterium]
ETISSLRVGVVDAQGSETRWLSIPEPAEGFYLGQIGWAGNSDELLVEKFSRFRDKREFLIADVRTGAITRMYYESDPAWVIASIRKNVGLEWIRDGRAFIVISEKDGWRHAYVVSRDGKEQALLTPGASDIIERVKVRCPACNSTYHIQVDPNYHKELDNDMVRALEETGINLSFLYQQRRPQQTSEQAGPQS